MISAKTIGRLSLYRRLLLQLAADGVKYIYSHDLAAEAGVSAAQVRRDIMYIGYSGNPNRGYDVQELIQSIGNFFDAPDVQNIAIIGVGNLGRAIMAYFTGRREKLHIAAVFDNDPNKYGRVIHGYRCYDVEMLSQIAIDLSISIGAICVPAGFAQKVADNLVLAGIRGILNFAPVPLHVPPDIYVENIDMTMAMEKVAYFARKM